MATYSSHRLIMGKEEIDNFFCLIGDIWNFFFIQKCLLSSPLRFIRLLSKSVSLIGCQRGSAAQRVGFRKNVKKSSSQKP